MKKKSPRGIPDFARHAPHERDGKPSETVAAPGAKPKRMPQPARIKLANTAVKSGQRGQ